MNTTQAKTELREYRRLNELIISKQIIFAKLKIRMENLKAMNSEKEIIKQKIIRAESEYERRSTELEKLVRYSEEIRKTINRKLDRMDSFYSKILRLKYFNGYSLLLMSTLLCYEYTWLCKLHARAVKKYASIQIKNIE